MKNILVGVVIAAVILVLAFYAVNSYIYREKQGDAGFQPDYKDINYTIEEQMVTLHDGVAETGSTVTRYFGNEAEGDLNNDGISDLVFLLTQETGGTGIFYYVVVALKTDTGYQGTNAVLLGDRIAPQTTETRMGQVIVNYAERLAGEPMTTRPSVGVSKYLEVQGTNLVEAKP